jgi:hypothetical protein
MPGNISYPNKISVPRRFGDAIKQARQAGEFSAAVVIEDFGGDDLSVECADPLDIAAIAARDLPEPLVVASSTVADTLDTRQSVAFKPLLN